MEHGKFRDSTRTQSSDSKASSSFVAIPEEPWLEQVWDKNSVTYVQLAQLYGGYFGRLHGLVRSDGEEERALVDFVLCQLNCFVGVDVLLDRKLLLMLVNSFAQTLERYLYKREFIRLMFFLSFAPKERLEEAVFGIVSGGQSRASVSQLVQMHTYRLQRPVSVEVINLISDCDRSGRGLLDVYDFRLLIGKLQALEVRQCSQTQPAVDEERNKLEEALMEAQELESWSWEIGTPEDASKLCSPQLCNLNECRVLLQKHPALADALSKMAWDFPEVLSSQFIHKAISQHCGKTLTGSVPTSSDEDAQLD